MKSIRVNILDRSQFGRVGRSWSSPGRPKKGVPKKKFAKMEFQDLGEKFYLKLANLKEKDIPNFIREHVITLPWTINGSNLAGTQDVLDFQKDVRSIIENIKTFKKIRKNGVYTQQAVYKNTNDLPNVINKYLDGCHLQVDLPPVISKHLSESDFNSYKNQVKDFTSESRGFLNNNVLKNGGYGTNFANLFFKCDSLLSWCILDLVADLLGKEELIRACKNCGRLFKASNLKNEYCQDAECQKEVVKIRKRRSRSNR